MSVLASDIQVFILAGGQSSRMGSDKGMLVWKEKIFVEHILSALKPIFNDIIIVSNRPMGYSHLGYDVIEDKVKDIGPLGGFYTGLHYTLKRLNLFVSCDSPMLSSTFFTEMLNSSSPDKISFCSVRGKLHPIPVLLNKDVLDKMEASIQRAMYKLMSFYDHFPCQQIDMTHFEHEMLNINTPDDYNSLISQQ